MGMGSSKQSSNSSGTFNENVWGGQQGALQGLYNNAAQLFGQTNSGMNAQMPYATNYATNVSNAAMPAYQQQLGGGAYDSLDANQVFNSINQSMGQPTATSQIYGQVMGGEGNNYADAMRSIYQKDANRAAENMMNVMDTRATQYGLPGSSRHGIAQAEGIRGINDNLQSNLAKVGYDTFDKDLTNKLNIAQMADSNNLSRQQMMTDMLGQKQAAMQGALNFGQGMQSLGQGAMNAYMQPWNAMNQYGTVVGPPTVLGSGTMAGGSSGKSKSAALPMGM